MLRFPLSGALCALLVLAAGPVGAQIYTWTDADGNRVYSDQPHPDATSVDVGPTNTIAPPTPTPAASRSTTSDAQQQTSREVAYRRLAITSPANDEAIRSNDGILTLTVETDPPLSGSHLLRADVGGQLSEAAIPGNGQPSQQLVLTDIDRGSHAISVVVLNARGDILQRSSPITVHLQRTSLNQPGRAGANQAPQAPAAPRAPNVPGPAPGSGGGN